VEQVVADVKTEGSARTFNLTGELLERLKSCKQWSEFSGAEDWIFASPIKLGRLPYSCTGVWRELERAASAAEIVAGALQDSHRAKIVGVTTFGTGTVLQQYTLSDGSALFLGTADWLTPAGHAIFGVGIKPDQTVDLPSTAQPIDPADMSKVTAAQVNASGDTQLLAALADLGQ